MRKQFVWMATALLVLGMAGVANAAVLNWAGTATILWAEFPPGILTGGGVATINSSSVLIPAHLNTLRLAASRGQVRGTFTRLVTDPDVFADDVAALVFDHVGGLTGAWGQLSGGAASTATGGGILPLGGIVKICVLSTACTLYFPLVLNQPTTLNGVPGTGSKGIGVGGLITAPGWPGLHFSLQAAPWTIKTATVLDQITVAPSVSPFVTWIAKGWAHAPVSTTTSTARPGGMVQLVTPSQVVTSLSLGSNYKKGSLVIMVIRFIPEPGLLLVGSGVAGLGMLGRGRLRSRARSSRSTRV